MEVLRRDGEDKLLALFVQLDAVFREYEREGIRFQKSGPLDPILPFNFCPILELHDDPEILRGWRAGW